MKVFCYFVEPAIYTLDLAKNIYVKNNIDYGFINSNTLVKSEEKTAKIFLDNLTFFSKLKFLITTYNNNDFIIVNGYNNYPFIVTFICLKTAFIKSEDLKSSSFSMCELRKSSIL